MVIHDTADLVTCTAVDDRSIVTYLFFYSVFQKAWLSEEVNVIVLLFEQLHSFVFATLMIDDGWRQLLELGRKEKKCFFG